MSTSQSPDHRYFPEPTLELYLSAYPARASPTASSSSESASSPSSSEEEAMFSTSPKTKNPRPFERTSVAGNKHRVAPSSACPNFYCTYTEDDGARCPETKIFEVPSKMR